MSDRTILLADDEPDIRLLVRTHLTRHEPWEVLEAEDGARAIAVYAERTFDLVILDQRMPQLNGTEVARALREDHAFDGPIVLFSAYIDAEVEDIASDLGLIAVEKSNMRQLREVVREHLAGDPPTP